MSKTRIALIVFALFLVAFLAWLALQQPPGRPNLSVKFLGYTNNDAGIPLAAFAVTNLSDSRIFIHHLCIVIPAPAEPRGFAYWGDMIRWQAMVKKGASDSFTVPSPTNQSIWRLSFLVDNDLGEAMAIKHLITASPRHMPFEFESDWIDDLKK